jgi:hypothetical protein
MRCVFWVCAVQPKNLANGPALGTGEGEPPAGLEVQRGAPCQRLDYAAHRLNDSIKEIKFLSFVNSKISISPPNYSVCPRASFSPVCRPACRRFWPVRMGCYIEHDRHG